MPDVEYLTEEGLKNLKEELQELKTTKRAEVSDKIQAAIEMGDLSENAAYSDAKDEQAFLEGRIREIEHTLKNYKLIEENTNTDVVSIGATVTIDCEGKKLEYTIVGSNEADPQEGRISNESPIGQALLDKKLDEEVEINVPKGKLKCKIIEIK